MIVIHYICLLIHISNTELLLAHRIYKYIYIYIYKHRYVFEAILYAHDHNCMSITTVYAQYGSRCDFHLLPGDAHALMRLPYWW